MLRNGRWAFNVTKKVTNQTPKLRNSEIPAQYTGASCDLFILHGTTRYTAYNDVLLDVVYTGTDESSG